MVDYKSPFHYLMKYMTVTGVLELPGVPWPLNNVVTLLSCFSQFALPLAAVLYCLTGSEPFFKNMEGFLIFVSNSHVASKVFTFVLRRKRLLSIMAFIEEMSKVSYNNGFQEVHRKDLWYSKRIAEGVVVSFVALHFLCNMISIIKHIFFKSDTAPIQLYVPFQNEGNLYWICAYCIVICVFPVINLAMVMSMVVTLVLNLSTQMSFLTKKLESLGDESSEQDTKSCIILHQKVLKAVKDVNDFLSSLMFFEYLVSSIQCCLSGYRLFIAKEESSSKMVGATIFVLTILVPGVNCISGEIIKNKGEQVFLSAYNNKWYQMSVSERKDLNLLMLVAERPLTLHFLNLLVFDLILFGGILRGAYSLVTALQTVSSS